MKEEKVLLGVCLWLGERFKINITGLRILFVAAALVGLRIPILSISPLILYLVLFLLKPKEHNNW